MAQVPRQLQSPVATGFTESLTDIRIIKTADPLFKRNSQILLISD